MDAVFKAVCLEITKRYAIVFVEIGTDHEHVHVLIQSVPTYSPMQLVKTITRLTAREIFRRMPTAKKQMWGGALWSKGSFISGKHDAGKAAGMAQQR